MNYFLLNIGQQLNNFTAVLITVFVECFLQFLKILHMHFINKNVPAKRGERFIWEKKRPAKARSQFYESGIPVTQENLFSYREILIFQ